MMQEEEDWVDDKRLVVPENIRRHRLPGYASELNPQGHVWAELREKEFPNRVFSDMAGVGAPWKRSCHGWRRIGAACAASAPGPGLLVST